MYGSSYNMFRHYIAILWERSWCLLRDAQLRSRRLDIVVGRVVSGDVVLIRTTSPDTIHRTLSDITYHISVGTFFGESKVFEIQHLKILNNFSERRLTHSTHKLQHSWHHRSTTIRKKLGVAVAN
jgi:hypothetical protein